MEKGFTLDNREIARHCRGEPRFPPAEIHLQRLFAVLGEADQKTPPVRPIRLPRNEAPLFERGEKSREGLWADTLTRGEVCGGNRPAPVKAAQDNQLRRAQELFGPVKPQPPHQKGYAAP